MNSNIFSHACVKTGIKGSLVGHGFCLIVFWLVSFGPTLAEFLLPAISLAIISVCVGAYTGLLVVSYSRLYPNRARGVEKKQKVV